MDGSIRAFLDASVLYPVTLRNLLMGLALSGLFRAHWSADVHAEWIRAVLRDRPDIPPERLHAVRAAMDRHAEDSLVAGYESLIPQLQLPDPDDRHVLAAAIVAGATVIVTRNLRDFPPDTLERHAIEARHPDAFLGELLDLAPDLVVEVVREQQADLVNPPVPMANLLALFERLDLRATAVELRRLMDLSDVGEP